MDELDLYVLQQLSLLIDKVKSAYDTYEFHLIYQSVNKFVVFLSSLYHDVIKDRLYTFATKSRERRATQTVMLEVITSLTTLMAPILSFTAEEIWSRLEPEGSVFLKEFPQSRAAVLSPEKAAKFERFLELRAVINKSLEEARQSKLIGGSLEAELKITAGGADYELLNSYPNLAELLIVSVVELIPGPEGPEPRTLVTASTQPKCPRCWNRHPQVTGDGVCPKCQKALAQNAAQSA
jgi:isoleucyl-tRNA synthetase